MFRFLEIVNKMYNKKCITELNDESKKTSNNPFGITQAFHSGNCKPIMTEHPGTDPSSQAFLNQSKAFDEIPKPLFVAEEKSKTKKKILARGLPLPIQDFKSQTERDPESIHQDLKVSFDDIITEPEGYYTPKFSWHLSQEVYGFAKGCCYSMTSFLCGIPLSFMWGVWFAWLACFNIWCLAPLLRSNAIKMTWWKACWRVMFSSFCDPISRSLGLIFSSMNVRTEQYIV